jgi:hypothetical protein
VTIERDTKLFLIPPGTARSFCKWCAQPIYWIEHQCKPKRKGEVGAIKPLPISLGHVLAQEPTKTTWGKGICHFADCSAIPARRPQQPQGQGATA